TPGRAGRAPPGPYSDGERGDRLRRRGRRFSAASPIRSRSPRPCDPLLATPDDPATAPARRRQATAPARRRQAMALVPGPRCRRATWSRRAASAKLLRVLTAEASPGLVIVATYRDVEGGAERVPDMLRLVATDPAALRVHLDAGGGGVGGPVGEEAKAV